MATPLGLPKRRQTTDTAGTKLMSSKLSAGIPRPSTAASNRVSTGFGGGGARKSSIQRGGRVSTSSGTRLSDRRSSRTSIYGQGPSTGYKKDPRPLSDKSYQQSCIRKLCGFLVENGYSRDVKQRTLQAPSTKEFLYILNFILESINSSLVVNGIKLEEEIPLILKLLGYPFPVSKNHLLSIGSPHSWPIMLGVLMWLIEGGQCFSVSPVHFFEGEGFDEDEENDEIKIDHNQLTDLYHLFLEFGEDNEDFEFLQQQRTVTAETLIETKTQELQNIEERLAQLELEKNELQKSSVGTLTTEQDKLQKDYDVSYQYVQSDLVPAIEAIERNTNEIQADINNKMVKVEEQKAQITEMLEFIKRQPISAREAQEIRQEIKEKRDSHEKMNRLKEENNEKIGELQMTHNRSVLKIDESCRVVNNRLRELGACLPSSSILVPLDYNSSKRADPSVLAKICEQRRQIKNGLQSLLGQCYTRYADIERDGIALSSAVSTIQNEMVKVKLEKEQRESTVEREKMLVLQAKQGNEEALRSDVTKQSQLETEMIKIRNELKERIIEEETAATKNDINKRTALMCSELTDKTDTLQELCVALSTYLEKEKLEDKELMTQFEALYKQFKSIPIPTVKAKYSQTQ